MHEGIPIKTNSYWRCRSSREGTSCKTPTITAFIVKKKKVRSRLKNEQFPKRELPSDPRPTPITVITTYFNLKINCGV